MATINELKTLIKSAIKPDVSKFSAADANAALNKAIVETFGLKELSSRQLRAKQPEVFALIEEVIEEMLPEAVQDIIGGFAEVRNFARNDHMIFKIDRLGRNRVKMGIVEGARGGIYKAHRLDSKYLELTDKVETVSAFVTLEEILLGTRSIGELMGIITEGFVEIIYKKTVKALRTAKTLAPAANITTGNNTITAANLDEKIRIANAYGTPIIMGFRTAISKINNQPGWTGIYPNISASDIEDVRNKGIVSMFHGVPIVELPNYLIDETNSGFIFKEGDVFILPSDSKPVKVGFRGELVIEEFKHPSGSVEQNAHRIVGVGLLLAQDVCVITDETISGGQY